jgi:hypothetical protein
MVGHLNGAVNVIHVHKADSEAINVGDDIAASVNASMWKCLMGGDGISALQITPLFGSLPTIVYPTDGSPKWHGSATGTDWVPSLAAVVSLKTALRGRSNRGRVFVGPVAESESYSGNLSTATAAAMQGGWASFGSSLIGLDSEHVVASYKLSTALTVTNYSVKTHCGTQRNRQGRG